MNYKERFISRMDEYKDALKKLQVENEKFNQDKTHSEDEIATNTKRLEGLHQEEYNELKTSLEAILKDKKEEIGSSKTSDLGRDYQLRLTNLLQVFKRDGSEMSKEMILRGLVLFTEDPMALDALRNTLIESGRDKDEVVELIALDDKDLTIAKLDSIRKSLNDKLKLSLTADPDEYLGYEPLLNALDDNFNYIG